MPITESRSLFGNLADMLLFFLIKIVPRILVIFIVAYLVSKSQRAIIILIIIIGALVFYVSPPSLSAIFLLKKTRNADDGDLTLFKLLSASKDQHSGIFMVNDSFLIKSLYGKASRYSKKISKKFNLNLDHYEYVQQAGRKCDFIELIIACSKN